MSKIQTISGRSSFATVCETARRTGYRLLVCSNSKTYLLKGWKVAVVPTENVAEYLQAQAPQNPVSTPETEPSKPAMPVDVGAPGQAPAEHVQNWLDRVAKHNAEKELAKKAGEEACDE